MKHGTLVDRITAGKLTNIDGEAVIDSHKAYKRAFSLHHWPGSLYLTETAVIWVPDAWFGWPARRWRASREDIRTVEITKVWLMRFYLTIRTESGEGHFSLDSGIWSRSLTERAEKWREIIKQWANLSS